MKDILIKTTTPDLIRNRTTTLIFIRILIMLAWGSAAMFMVYLLMGSYTLIDLGFNTKNALLIDASLCMVFFLQHSLLIRRPIRRKLSNYIPTDYYNAFYGITSVVALLLVLILWQESPILIARAEGVVYWVLRALFFVAIVGFYWGAKSLGSFDALGVKPIMSAISNRPSKPPQFSANGPYRWARHPLYLFMIMLIWACPVLTLDRLLFNSLWTMWIVIGTYLEDRDLHVEFGSQYDEYSSRVPILIPYRIPK
jgi:methanethiol S-methyltransferase